MIRRSPSFAAVLAATAVVFCVWNPSALWAQSMVPAQTEAASQLVTIGRLIRSGQSRNGTPRFALLADDGSISAYVVPSSGLNLTHYLNQPVAVTARRATRGSDGLVYLLAQRVHVMQSAPGGETLGPAGELPPPGVSLASAMMPAEPSLPLNEPRILPDMQAMPLAGAPAPVPFSLQNQPRLVAGNNLMPESTIDGMSSPSADPLDLEAAFWNELGSRGGMVQPAAHQIVDEPIGPPLEAIPNSASMMVAPDYAFEDQPYVGGAAPMMAGGGGCGRPGCNSCQFDMCNSSCCPCGPMGLWWLQADYLLWWTKSMDLPPLVTSATGNPLAQDAGVLGIPGTQVLYGDESIFQDSRNGGRFRLGRWLDMCHWRGFEVEYAFLESETETFSRTSTGNPILARPFFNTQRNEQDAELVAYPGVVSGALNIQSTTDFHTLAPRFRWNLRCQNFLPHAANGCGMCNDCGDVMCRPAGAYRVDFTLGYRYMNLDESLVIGERLLSSAGASTAAFDLTDTFRTDNEFHGVELGMVWDYYRGPWSLEFLSRFALGNNRRQVMINGVTSSTVQGAGFTDVGGLLALQSNIGTYEDDSFVVIPELGVNLGYQIAPSLQFIVGYTFIYWGDVVRPGDQIDLRVNPNLLPPVVTTAGSNSPAFAWNDTNYWAQGLNLGLDWRW